MIIDVIDTETTSLEGSVCEIAVVEIDTESGEICDYGHSLIKPDEKISFGAMGVHHITDDMVADAPPLVDFLNSTVFGFGSTYAAHNAPFDKEKMPEEHRKHPWICTLRCAKHLLPNADSYKNQSLRYELGLDVSDMPAEAGGLAHRALYDTWCTAKLLLKLDELTDVPLVELSAMPVLLKTCNFGKHRGTEWANVPKDYLRWASNQDFDEDTAHTIKHYLN